MTLEKLQNAKIAAQTFENKIKLDLEAKYIAMGFPREAIRYLVAPHINLNKFIELYEGQRSYPSERLPDLITLLMDVKFEFVLFDYAHMGQYNTSNDSILRQLSLDQETIVKSRIIAERIMKFIYFLEMGKDMSGKGSIKGRFEKLIDPVSRWQSLKGFVDIVKKYDDSFRRPELHQRSTLRRCYMRGISPVSAELLKLTNNARNTFWPNLQLVLKGHFAGVTYQER